jgi:RNase H-like domain found in reverse transcriptase
LANRHNSEFWPFLGNSEAYGFQLHAVEGCRKELKKELLAIIRALRKWCTDLLGTHFYVYTDHRTLENFDTQKDLSRWLEFMSQYKMTVTYICGEDNTVADALLKLPPNCFPDKIEQPIAAVLSVSTDHSILDKIKAGYETDEFCKCVAATSMKGWTTSNGLWYINDRLLIPRVTDVHEQLFCLAHDSLGHFGVHTVPYGMHIIGQICVAILRNLTSPHAHALNVFRINLVQPNLLDHCTPCPFWTDMEIQL